MLESRSMADDETISAHQQHVAQIGRCVATAGVTDVLANGRALSVEERTLIVDRADNTNHLALRRHEHMVRVFQNNRRNRCQAVVIRLQLQNDPAARFGSSQLAYQGLLRRGLGCNGDRIFRTGSRIADRFLFDLGFHLHGNSLQRCLLLQSRRFASKLRAVQVSVLCQSTDSFQNLPQRVALLSFVNTWYAYVIFGEHQQRLSFYRHGNIVLRKDGDNISARSSRLLVSSPSSTALPNENG